MIAKFTGKCYECGVLIYKGQSCDYEKGRGVRCFNCSAPYGEFVKSGDTIPEKQATETPLQLAIRLGYRPHGEWCATLAPRESPASDTAQNISEGQVAAQAVADLPDL